MKLNILMLQWFQHPSKYLDGSYIHRIELTKELANLGISISLISINNLELDNNHINIYHLSSYNTFSIGANYFRALLYISTKNKFNIIYARHPFLGIIGLLFKKVTGGKLVYEINGIRENNQKNAENHLRKVNLNCKVKTGYGTGPVSVWLDNFVAKHADAIIAVTPKIRDYLLVRCGITNSKIHIILNGANTDLFRPKCKEESRINLGLNEYGHYICFVGSLLPWHGVEYLVQSAPDIIATISDTKFLIIGDSPLREEYIRLAQKLNVINNFIFAGSVSYLDVPNYINSSDICVAPFTKAIGEHAGLSPLKIYEYLACAKPVIASYFSDLEFIKELNLGVLVKPEDPKALAKAIIQLLREDDLREEMGKNGRVYVIENHSWKSVAKKTMEIFKLLVE